MVGLEFGGLEFATSTPICAALGVIAGSPLLLALVARVAPLKGRNALQFACTALVGLGAWLLWVCAEGASMPELLYGFALLAAAQLFYLEIWGLLSRGYTLGVLATLDAAARPLSAEEIATRYRGGDGLEWIMRHRMGGLVAAGLVAARDERFALTPLGAVVARCSRAAAAALNLRAAAR